MLGFFLCSLMAVVHVAAQNASVSPITISGPASLTRCGSNPFTWSGGVPPFSFFSSIPGVEVTQLSASGLTSRSYSFNTIWAPGYRLNFLVTDANGTSGSLTGILVTQGTCDINTTSSVSTTTTTTRIIISDSTSEPTTSRISTTTQVTSSTTASSAANAGTIQLGPSAAGSATPSSSPTATNGVSSISSGPGGVLTVSQTTAVSTGQVVATTTVASPTATFAETTSPTSNIGVIAGGAAGGVMVLLVVIALLLWRRRQRAPRGIFARVDLTEPSFAVSNHGDKPEVSDTVYHVTPYGQPIIPSISQDVRNLSDQQGGHTRDTKSNDGVQASYSDDDFTTSAVSTHVWSSSSSQARRSVAWRNRPSFVGSAVDEVAPEEEDMGDTLPPNYLSVVGQSKVHVSTNPV